MIKSIWKSLALLLAAAILITSIMVTPAYAAAGDDLIYPDADMIGWYKLDDAAGSSTAVDSSGKGNDSKALAGTFTPGQGRIGGAMQFNGESDYIQLNYDPEPNVNFLHGEFTQRTVSLWFKADKTTNTDVIQTYNGTDYEFKETQVLFEQGGNVNGLALQINDGKLEAQAASNATGTTTSSAVSYEFTDTTDWHNVCLVFDGNATTTGGAIQLYLDGDLKSSTVTPFKKVNSAANQAAIGSRLTIDAFNGGNEVKKDGVTIKPGRGPVANGFFQGMIDDVRIYNTPVIPQIAPETSVAVESVSLNTENETLRVGDQVNIAAAVLPDNATNKTLTWSSSDFSVVTVINGMITAKGAGNATITAAATDGSGFSDTCQITVEPVSAIEGDLIYPDSRQSGLDGWYKLDEPAGSYVASDSSGSSHDSKFLSGLFRPGLGKLGGALELNGENNYMELIDGAAPNTAFLKSAFTKRTISLWFKADKTTNTDVTQVENGKEYKFKETQVLFEQGGNANGLAIQINDNKLEAQVASNATGPTLTSTVRCDFTDTSDWHNVCVVFDGNAKTFKLYLDGVLKSTQATGFSEVKSALNNAAAGARLTIDAFGGGLAGTDGTGSPKPARGQNPNGFFKGMIDDVRVYNATIEPQSLPETAIEIENIVLSPETQSLTKGEEADILAAISPEDAANKNLVWSSSDPSIVTVTNGRVKAVKAGTVTITAAAADGSGVSGTCTVEAVPLTVTGITLSKSSLVMPQNNFYTISAVITPANAALSDIIWTSSDTSVAAVVDGRIEGTGDGHAVITAASPDGKVQKTCEVEVIGAEENSKIYLMPYFYGSINQTEPLIPKLHYAFSRDGIRWYELNSNQPAVELGDNRVRDPMIGKGPDGKWRLVFTRPYTNPDINPNYKMANFLGYSESDDLIHWSEVRALDVMANYEKDYFVPNSWAPEWVYDPANEEYILFWSSTLMPNTDASKNNPNTNDNKHYYVTTKDWVTFSEAKPLFTPGVKSIDASITAVPADTMINGKKLVELLEGEGTQALDNTVWFMFFKDETPDAQGGMRNRYTWSVNGPLGGTEPGTDPSNDYNENLTGYITPLKTEGSTLFPVGNRWHIIYDYWWSGKFGLKITANPADPGAWTDESSDLRIPFRARHCGITEIDQAALWELINHYNTENKVTFNETVNNRNVVIEGDAALKSGYVQLDGTDDGITLNNAADSFFMRTVSMWVKANDTQKSQLLYNEGDTAGGLGIRLEGGRLYAAASKGGAVKTAETSFEDTKKWHFVTVQYTDGVLQLYVDGTIKAELNTGFQPKQFDIINRGTRADADLRDPELYCIEKTKTDTGIGMGKAGAENAFGADAGYFDGYIGQVNTYTVPLLAEGVAELYNGTKADYSTIPEEPASGVSGVALDKTAASLTAGGTLQLTATVNPADAKDKSVTWSVQSSNPQGAVTVTEGLVAAVKAGTAVVRATSNADKTKYAECTVTVTSGSSNNNGGSQNGSNPAAGTTTPVSNGAGTTPEPAPVLDNATKTASLEISKEKLEKEFAASKTAVIEIPKVEGAESYEVTVPASVLSGSGDRHIDIVTELGKVTVPANMLGKTAASGAQNAALSITQADTGNMHAAVKAEIGNRPVVELNVKVDGKAIEWSNKNAPVTVALPYKPTAEELVNPEHITIWYIDGSGNAVAVPRGRYDAATETVTFTTTHLGKYAVVYVNKSFEDIAGYTWAKNAIEVMASKGIIYGTSETTYSPGQNIKRADFIVLLVKVLGLSTQVDKNFDDVKAGSYYYEAVGTAKALGITEGVGDNKFNPSEQISRQDMMVLVEKALRIAEKPVAAGSAADLAGYKDTTQVSGYAVNSVSALVKDGIIAGSANRINPKAWLTRAEAAAVIYKLYNK